MTALSPAQDELTRRILDARLADVHTSAPGTVVSFDATNYTVDVRLGAQRPVARWDGGVAYEEPPILPAVPVATFGSTRAYNRPDLQPGDIVWVLFSETSPAEFLAEGEQSQPGDTARHSLSGGLAIPITLPGKLSASPKVCLGGAGGDFVALAAKVDARCKAIEDYILAHVHVVTDPISGPLTTAVSAPPIEPGGSTAATEVQAV
jgi:hypothetical protein